MAVNSLGVDVSGARGFELVLLDRKRRVRGVVTSASLDTLRHSLVEWRPSIVAVTGPPAFSSSGSSRRVERELARLNLRSYRTPGPRAGASHASYGWMRESLAAYAVCRDQGYSRYRKGSPRGHALEVFPHAGAVVLLGGLEPVGVGKRAWRERALAEAGVGVSTLRTRGQVDAAVAALVGLFAFEGRCVAIGDPEEGVIVLPCEAVPESPFRRVGASALDASGAQPRLPGLTPCACGEPDCRETTASEFAPGHDAKRKSSLWRQVREGVAARRELRRRGWGEPPDV